MTKGHSDYMSKAGHRVGLLKLRNTKDIEIMGVVKV